MHLSKRESTLLSMSDMGQDVKSAMIGMLEPEYKEVINGKAEVRMTYKISNVGTIAGCYVIDGKIVRNSEVRVIRDGIVIFESTLASLTMLFTVLAKDSAYSLIGSVS